MRPGAGDGLGEGDHKTGKPWDLLCHHSNLLLGHAQDSTERVRQAIAYLERTVAISTTIPPLEARKHLV
ncbi:endonuclease domain-containing protein [Streptomyces massasporeus]|uniref:endonuclease domain-containing protein n=1 Tax=Streptomyces massasporeus TaxID=67324 RepID=UPI0033DD846F